MSERKKLLFAPPYPQILFTEEKTKTFRVTGGEKFNVNDLVSLCFADGREFAQAVISDKYRKRFEELDEKDWEGHERFSSEQEMYQTYSNWEGFPVNRKTELDILVYKKVKRIKL